jgi:hypothetical protein
MDRGIEVICPQGWSYVKPNFVKIFMNGVDVTQYVYELLKATHEPSRDPELNKLVCDNYNDVFIQTQYGESFTGEDWIGWLEEMFALEITYKDGEIN